MGNRFFKDVFFCFNVKENNVSWGGVGVGVDFGFWMEMKIIIDINKYL